MTHEDAAATPRVRAARPEDRAAVVRVTRAAYAEYAGIMAPSAWAALEGAVESSLASDVDVTRLVAELDGEIVGSAALHAPDSDAYGSLASAAPWPEVRLVAVAPAARGRRVAHALVEECIRRARDAGSSALGLHTSQSMRAAKRLYRRLGFVRDPERDFQPPGAELVEGYLLRLDDVRSPHQP